MCDMSQLNWLFVCGQWQYTKAVIVLMSIQTGLEISQGELMGHRVFNMGKMVYVCSSLTNNLSKKPLTEDTMFQTPHMRIISLLFNRANLCQSSGSKFGSSSSSLSDCHPRSILSQTGICSKSIAVRERITFY